MLQIELFGLQKTGKTSLKFSDNAGLLLASKQMSFDSAPWDKRRFASQGFGGHVHLFQGKKVNLWDYFELERDIPPI